MFTGQMAINNAADLIKDHEDASGPHLHVYTDTTGNKTIGWGHKLPSSSDIEDITLAEAQAYFDEDYQKAADAAANFVSNYDSLTTARQAVLIDMAFNLGKAGLSAFRKFKAAIEANDFDKAADEMLDSKWATQVGRRATEDAAIMRSGSF